MDSPFAKYPATNALDSDDDCDYGIPDAFIPLVAMNYRTCRKFLNHITSTSIEKAYTHPDTFKAGEVAYTLTYGRWGDSIWFQEKGGDGYIRIGIELARFRLYVQAAKDLYDIPVAAAYHPLSHLVREISRNFNTLQISSN